MLLVIADVDPPGGASIIATPVTGSKGNHVALSGNYAYVIDSSGSLMRIIDVTTPDAPSLVKELGVPTRADSIMVQNGYAYIGYSGVNSGLAVMDIEPYDTAYLVSNLDTTPYGAYDIIRAGNYLYTTASEQGLRIFEVI